MALGARSSWWPLLCLVGGWFAGCGSSPSHSGPVSGVEGPSDAGAGGRATADSDATTSGPDDGAASDASAADDASFFPPPPSLGDGAAPLLWIADAAPVHASDCKPGTYAAGTFTMMVGGLVGGGLTLTGNLSITLVANKPSAQFGEFNSGILTVAPGAMFMAKDNLGDELFADISGQLDCGSRMFVGTLSNGGFYVFGNDAATGTLDGSMPLSATYDTSATPPALTNGSLHVQQPPGPAHDGHGHMVRGAPVNRRSSLALLGVVVLAAACGNKSGGSSTDVADDGGNAGGGPSPANGSSSGGGTPGSFSGSGGTFLGDSGIAASMPDDPTTCGEAAQAHSYIGCDYWPTVLANTVWDIFDFAVVVANPGQTAASVTVTGPSGTNQTAMVPPAQLAKIYLPWVPALKGPGSDACGNTPPFSSVLQTGGAFHLVSTVPVTVYQFSALEYQPKGGPANKDWSMCPGYMQCMDTTSPNDGIAAGCYSFSNDASLLLPSTAMTGNYRVAGHEGVVVAGQSQTLDATMAITGTQAGTTVNVKVASAGQIGAGTGIQATAGGGTLTLTLGAGDVAELVAAGGSDLSGSLVQASAPVQIITGHPCIQVPPSQPSCDHIEESVVPAETLGKHYVVTGPAGPNGNAVAHQVRFYGNFDGTHLTYNPPTPPAGCPATLEAGQVVECGVPACPMTVDPNQMSNCGVTLQDFEVQGDQPFAVGTFTLGSSVVDNTGSEGDPAQSFATAVEQYRSSYVFLAPDDYSENYVDIVARTGVGMALDGHGVTAVPEAVGTGGYVVYRQKLGSGQAGAHTLVASDRVGIQVVGYGTATSWTCTRAASISRTSRRRPSADARALARRRPGRWKRGGSASARAE